MQTIFQCNNKNVDLIKYKFAFHKPTVGHSVAFWSMNQKYQNKWIVNPELNFFFKTWKI